ncbi:helix-turn-helix domain-containing protein [Actinomadura namibiensis]|uniref:Transcriptional regulator with XRE-family HTH domain n=1 Tax=Actinomadura namibiensis TaxID=182080 RepID=A0A7W3QR97_ACTNM|nr:helix-turn-helix transcriptional regulator [Actinomadura namibiensis]MBA8956560.1 transcriptional regulator with XRE-family HTH domain [Actinomadura namibiensis]
MAGSPETSIGDRIRFYRHAAGKTQAVVAGLAGITEDYLSQLERGMRTPSITLLHNLSGILMVPTSALLGESGSGPVAVERNSAASDLQAALMIPVHHRDLASPPPLPELRDRVDAAWASWQRASERYSQTGPLLPGLVRDVEAALHTHGPERRQACQIAADLYFLLRTYTKRIGRTDLALLVADRGRRAAEDADDPLRIAAAQWNVGQVQLSTNEADAAEDIAIHAIEELDRARATVEDVPRTALQGALWLVATIAAVRKKDNWAARELLREKAFPAAQRAGEGNVFWTVFGPTNVTLHAVTVEMESGETGEALRLADEIDIVRCPSVERRATFYLELARGYEQRRDDTGVLLHLLDVEREAPEDMRYNPLVRDLVHGLLRRARPTLAPQVRDLADRIGLVA